MDYSLELLSQFHSSLARTMAIKGMIVGCLMMSLVSMVTAIAGELLLSVR